MSHHADPVEENIETHPVKLAIAVTVGAIGLVIGIILLAYFAVGTHKVGGSADSANTPEAVAKRIAPLTDVVTDASKAPASAPASAPAKDAPTAAIPKSASIAAPIIAAVIPPASAAPAASTGGGEGTYKTACSACHATGVAGAPKTGDKAAWAPRIAKGKPLLYEHALKGFNAMPAKGGNATLADNDVKAAVDYLLAQAK